ncbi:MAG: ATP-binding cassette domain-containing protein [Pseudomonadota bacterium]
MPVPADGGDIIETLGLGRRYGEHRALSDIGLRVRRGEIFGVLGPDGAGKTTLMQLFAAILDPTEGQCRVLGFDTVHEAERITARIGYMSQGFTLYDRLTVDENLAFAARIRGVGGEVFQHRRARLLEMAGLAPFGMRRAGQLSGGMRKKLSLCTNLIHEPPLLLLDEPSLGVDPRSRRELWRMLRAFRDQGATVVLTTPYMDEAMYCDRLAFLHRGTLLAVDTPQVLCARSRGRVFELRATNLGEARRRLAAYPEVIATQWLADRLRFQTAAAQVSPAPLQRALSDLGAVHEVESDLENTFVQLASGTEAWGATTPEALAPREVTGEAVAAVRVTVRFGAFTAVDDVSIRIAPGEVVGWLGPNGAGKTTLIRVLCGLLQPAAGVVRVAGVDVSHAPMPLKERIGYMSQRFSLYPDLTVAENLAFFAGVYGLRSRERRAAMIWATEMTGLVGMEGRHAGKISGALRQRVALACAIMHRPAVLFLDEPTSGVDPMARSRFWQLIQSLAGAGMAVLVTTHYLEEARYCHRLGLMAEGRLIALGTLDELRAGLGVSAGADMEAIFMAYLARVPARETVP